MKDEKENQDKDVSGNTLELLVLALLFTSIIALVCYEFYVAYTWAGAS